MANAPYTNKDGLQVKFPNYYKDPANFFNRARALNTVGLIKEIVIDYDLELLGAGGISYTSDLNNDGTLDGFNTGDVCIPANSNILSVDLFATETAAGGTSVILGTYTLAGAAIDADGLITATEGVTANMQAGERVTGAGALLAVSSNVGVTTGTADSYLALDATGTFTAGKGRILLRYVDPLGDA